MDKKHKILFVSIVITVLISGIFSFMIAPFHPVLADSDEYEQEEQESEDRYEREDETKNVSVADDSVVTEVVTISETQSKETVTTTKKDQDGDGIYDSEDRYPRINDHYIVVDDDRNGIVDVYEKK